jgi:hypothetical protein
MAMPEPQDASVQVRIYDRDHKDYHVWDDREDLGLRAVSFGKSQECSRILEGEQKAAIAILELAPQSSR